MVNLRKARRFFALTALLLCAAISASAQSYDVNDTVTEYPMKGTFYHNKFEGRKTASGEIFNQNLFTAAHKKIKMGTFVLVTNKNTGLSVIVKINDRCPKKSVMDMTRRAAHAIGIRGSQPVIVRILPDGYEKRWAAQDKMFDSVPSRLSNNPPESASDKQDKTSEKKQDKPKETKKPKKDSTEKAELKSNSLGMDRYNIQLGSARSHGEAFEMVELLPSPYQEKAIMDTSGGEILVTLEVNLTKSKARELNRALKHNFPDARITPSE